ncbi:uncharacterized protein isoform X2 [Leptinotarsa decemlineata]|uniref:uncharacterized protein isoform X2 n=1 Tax=Leptinotarsa decemlineata TaxID=7539 RepID=UPI003D305964
MKHTIKVFVFLNLITSMSLKRASLGENDKLVAVSVLYRHGARGPSSSYPNDPYLDVTYWPNGLGQLVDTWRNFLINLGLNDLIGIFKENDVTLDIAERLTDEEMKEITPPIGKRKIFNQGSN